MLCRRCGMESSTTETCEWCNRPMLPAGPSVSGKAAKEMRQSGRPLAVSPQPGVEPEAGRPLNQQQAEEPVAAAQAEAAPRQPAPDVLLRPLGGAQAADQTASPPAQAAQRPGVPSHGLSHDATKTSIDISQYVGADQSIFRPIRKDASYSSAASLDRVAQKKTSAQDQTGPNWSENERLGRCVIAGLASSMVMTLLQFFTKLGTIPDNFYGLRIAPGGGLTTALVYAIGSGLILGVGLGAILTRLKRGSFIGMVLGLLVAIGLKNSPYTLIAGAMTGILAGRFATLGVRRVINV